MTVGQWENALADFQKAWELEPENTFAYNNAGCVYKYTGQYDKAVELFKKAAEVMKEGETMLPYGNLADCYERMSEYEKAAEADVYKRQIQRALSSFAPPMRKPVFMLRKRNRWHSRKR